MVALLLYSCLCLYQINEGLVFRITQSSCVDTFPGLFLYLENNLIIKDKAGMWQCIAAVTSQVFKIFLNKKAEMVSVWLVCVCNNTDTVTVIAASVSVLHIDTSLGHNVSCISVFQKVNFKSFHSISQFHKFATCIPHSMPYTHTRP